MKSILDTVSPILNSKTAKVTLDISAASTDGEMMVIVKPIVGPVSEKAPEELKMLSAALSQPLKVVGEPHEIEDKLAELVQEQSGKRNQWANRAAELDAAIAAAASTDTKNTSAKPAAKAQPTPQPASEATVQTDDLDAEDDQDSTAKAAFDL